jgi:hypothetical protein
MATKNIVPRADNEGSLGTDAKRWATAKIVTVTGNLVGNVTGDVTGGVTGNVTGALTGNADTATTLTGVLSKTLGGAGDVTGILKANGSGTVSAAAGADLLSTHGTQTANTVLSGPTTGAAANPTFRALVAADLGTTMAPTFGSTTVNGLEVTTTNKNKHNVYISDATGALFRIGTYYWNGSSYAADRSTGFGYGSITSNIGIRATGIGYLALNANTGNYSTAVGYSALNANTGANATGVGYLAMGANTGATSTGLGYQALQNNSGTSASGVGNLALQNNTGSAANGFGAFAARNNIGSYANGFGSLALEYNKGDNVNAIGSNSAQYNTGSYSNALGGNALDSNVGSYVDAVGYNALSYNNSMYVVGIGYQAAKAFSESPHTGDRRTFDDSMVDGTAHTITFATAHGLGTAGNLANLKFTLVTGTAPTGLVDGTVYLFTVTSTTVLTLSTVTSTGSADFTGILSNPSDIENSVAVGANANASTKNQVVLGNSSMTEVQAGAGGVANVLARSTQVTTPTAGFASMEEGVTEELITLSTSGTTTDSTWKILPANSEILSIAYKVETAVTGSGVSGFQIGDGSTAARFCGTQSVLTAGATGVGLAHRQGSISTDATGPVQATAANLRITAVGGTPDGGVVRVAVFHRTTFEPSWLVMEGDSKSLVNTNWPLNLTTTLGSITGQHWHYVTNALGGQTVVQRAAQVDADITRYAGGTVKHVLVNLGVNGLGSIAEADWKTAYAYILDAYHTAYPRATVWCTKPWMRDGDADCVTMAGWIDDVLVARSTWASVGDNEAAWMKGGDNGVTMTSDGIHPNATGQAEKVVQVLTELGY